MPLLEWHAYGNPIADNNFRTNLSKLNPDSATFATAAMGGFADGALSFSDVADPVITDCLNHWLMRRVVAMDGGGFTAYEGFIAEIEVRQGFYTYRRSIDSLTNSVKVGFIKPYLNATMGASVWVNDLPSQAQYGIKEAYESIAQNGVIPATQATAWGQTYLNTRSIPHDNYFDLGADVSQRTIQLTLWGYYTTLGWRENTLKWTGATDIKTIVSGVLTGSGKAQFIATSDLTHLATTGTTIVNNTNGDSKPLQDYIEDVCQYGDSNNRRVLFQILEGRVPWLFARSVSPIVYARSNTDRLWSQAHAALPSYKVRAGGYAVAEDFGGSLDSYADVLSDPRSTFIESTSYDAIKDKLSINPPDDTAIELLLGRMIKGKRRIKI
jgi:hypothetical protein